jgi:hypothetical protein
MEQKMFLRTLSATLLAIVIAACTGAPTASNPPAATSAPVASSGVSLDTVIVQAARRMEERLPSGTKVAIVSVASPSTTFSSYVIDSLEAALVDKDTLKVVDRANLDKIREEQGFQLSGEVSDSSAKAIGQLLGAGAIVTGSLLNIGSSYRLTLKAINIESAEVAVSYPADIASDERVKALLASGGGSSVVSNRPAAPTVAIATAPAQAAPAPVVPAAPKNGTYTFFPRLRAWRGANNVDAYLDRIIVRNGYLTVYLKGTASGDDKDGYRFMNFSHWQYNNSHMDEGWWINWGDHRLIKEYMNKVLLQDLDNPSKSYKAMDVGKAEDGGRYYSFQNVQGTKFKLTDGNNPPNFFEEILLENPD